jgi:glycosyltransferase involved in cell wall biosynthesis
MLVSGTDVEELAGTIDQLRRSPELRSRLGAAGRERVLHDFTWEAASLKLRAFHELIASEP